MNNSVFDFEKPLFELEEKINELKQISEKESLDISAEIEKLEEKLKSLKKEIYYNMSPWQKVQIARHPARPTALDYIKGIFEDFIEIHGDKCYSDDKAIVGGIASINNLPVTVIGHQKGNDIKEKAERNFGMPHPEGYRKALRLMQQAEKFERPIICFIDTPGAFCGIGAEERGQGAAIAKNLMEMAVISVPIIVIVIGEGGSGGALALGVGDTVGMLEHSIYSVLSPEGFASILWRDAKRAKEAADVMKLTANDLLQFGIIDQIIKEPMGGAHKNPDSVIKEVKSFIINSLEKLNSIKTENLLEMRYMKYRNMGNF